MAKTIALIFASLASAGLSASAQFVSATAYIPSDPSMRETERDSSAPYTADAVVSRNGSSFTSSSTLDRQSTETSGSASGTLTAFGSIGPNAEFGEARAVVLDTWNFALAQAA